MRTDTPHCCAVVLAAGVAPLPSPPLPQPAGVDGASVSDVADSSEAIPDEPTDVVDDLTDTIEDHPRAADRSPAGHRRGRQDMVAETVDEATDGLDDLP